jgi:hypothetical protein
MLRMSIAGRTARALAAGALILSLAGTTFVGSANAAPLADQQGCSAAVHARNAAFHALHDAWKASVGDLKSLLTDQNKSDKELRHELFGSWRDLKSVAMGAKETIEDVDLGAVCHDEDDDKNVSAAQGAATTTDVSALEAKFKAIVDQAIKDMQAVVTGARKTVADMTAATDVAKDEDKDDDDKDDGDKNNSHENSKVKSTNHAKAADLAKMLKSKHNGRHHEDD